MQRSQPLLGTFVTISAYGTNRTATLDALSAAFEEFRKVDEWMSAHRADSELSRVNARAAHEDVEVSPELFLVVSCAQEIARATDGSFDITVGPLAELWGFRTGDYRLPSEAELHARLSRVGYRRIELDAQKRRVRFAGNDVSLDLGGIGKGYAVDRAVASLLRSGIRDAMVKAGGDLRVLGAPPGARHWTVQLEDPRKLGRRVSLALRDAALSTSGNYEQFFEVAGRRYSHILDPRTGWPVEGIAACTVIAPTCMESDAWATACFVLGVEESLRRFGERLAIRFTLFPEDNNGTSWRIRSSASFPEARGR